MQDFIIYINGLNMTTWFIVGSLVFVGGFIMQMIVDSRMLTAMFMFAFQVGALGLNYLSVLYNVSAVPNPEMNLIALSTIGMVLALIVSLFVMRITDAISDAIRPKVTRDTNPIR